MFEGNLVLGWVRQRFWCQLALFSGLLPVVSHLPRSMTAWWAVSLLTSYWYLVPSLATLSTVWLPSMHPYQVDNILCVLFTDGCEFLPDFATNPIILVCRSWCRLLQCVSWVWLYPRWDQWVFNFPAITSRALSIAVISAVSIWSISACRFVVLHVPPYHSGAWWHHCRRNVTHSWSLRHDVIIS